MTHGVTPGGAPRLAVVGAGLMGRQHIAAIAASNGGARLAAVVDPTPEARALAEASGAAWHRDLDGLLASDAVPDGIILATPNRLHEPQAGACIAAGVPVLVEKPLAESAAAGARIVTAAEAAGVPLLVGQHRRHSPIAAAAKARIAAGDLGDIVAVQGTCWLYKPPEYFETEWRRQPGGGPILINLVHDIDLMRHFCGEVTSVQAHATNAQRGFAVEDTAAVILAFEGGAVATLSVSDTAVAPWSWELTAAENPAYPVTGQSCYLISGTRAALSVPDMTLWRNPGPRGWWQPIEPVAGHRPGGDPLTRQVRHFAEVIAGRAAPLVPGREGLRTLEAVEAVQEAARTGNRVIPTRHGGDTLS